MFNYFSVNLNFALLAAAACWVPRPLTPSQYHVADAVQLPLVAATAVSSWPCSVRTQAHAPALPQPATVLRDAAMMPTSRHRQTAVASTLGPLCTA